MATIINADTSDGLKLTSDTSGQLELQSAGSTKVTMDTSGKVGIGGTPSEPLSVFRTGGQTEGINIRNTSSGNGSRLTFETTRSDDSSVQDMAAVQVYALTGYDSAANSNSVMTFETQDSGTTAERMRLDNDGNVLVAGTSFNANGSVCIGPIGTAANGCTAVSASSSVTNMWRFYNPNGNVGTISTSGSATSYATSSDYRLKENVAPMSGSIDRLKQLKPSTWAWIQDGSHGEGFLAHEAQEIVPECATGTKDAMRTEEYEVTPAVEATYDEEDNELTPAVEAVMGTREVPDYQGIDQSKLVPLLTAALQEAITKIEDLETRIQALENA